MERLLRALCRCDGARDMAVVAALLVVAATLAFRLAPALPPVCRVVNGSC
ncbi:MAG TPA: hypothetical protein PLL32_09720 [Anaeromyxobacteraceae bacterium]|nr:hypothetical protein [Anaeromyxobacteraceae bacterium]